jgi:acyl dehydratase
VGSVFEFGSLPITEQMIIEFASKYDAQPFHVDPQAAKQSPYGGLIASGWMTGSLLMSQLVEHYYSPQSSLGSPGLDELRWPAPVLPGDTLTIRATVLDARVSQSKPDRGLVRSQFEVLNQDGVTVMSVKGWNLMLRRPTV